MAGHFEYRYHAVYEEIVRIYGMRWDIETFFKFSKSFLHLAKEFQGRSYDMMISHTTIVFTRYILIAWQLRKEEDPKTMGNLFLFLCDEVKEMDFKNGFTTINFSFPNFGWS